MDLQTRPMADQGQSTRVYGRKDISLGIWMLVTGVGHGQQHSKDVTNVQKLSPISSLRCHLHNVIYSSRFHLCSITYAKRILIRIHDVSRKVRCRRVSKLFRVLGFRLWQCPSPRFDSVHIWYFRFCQVYVRPVLWSVTSSVSTKLWSMTNFWKLDKEVLSNTYSE